LYHKTSLGTEYEIDEVAHVIAEIQFNNELMLMIFDCFLVQKLSDEGIALLSGYKILFIK